jgi:hypothetical protein
VKRRHFKPGFWARRRRHVGRTPQKPRIQLTSEMVRYHIVEIVARGSNVCIVCRCGARFYGHSVAEAERVYIAAHWAED